MAKRENDALRNTSSSLGTTGGTVLSSARLDDDNTILNSDEDTISDTPLRNDLQTGMSADVSGGTSAGTYFEGNRDADSDAGLSDSYTVPITALEDDMDDERTMDANDTLALTPTSSFSSSTDTFATTASPFATTAKPESAVDTAKSAVADAADSAKDQAGALISQAKEQVSGIAQQATSQIKEQLGSQKEKAAGSLDSVTQLIRQTADNFSDNGQPQIGNAVASLSTKLEDLTGYLRGKDIDEIAGEIQTYAKQNPQVVVGGAFLLGIALARFLKASAKHSSTTTALTTYNGGSSSYYNEGYAASGFNTTSVPVVTEAIVAVPVVTPPVILSSEPDYMGTSSTATTTTTTDFNTNSGTSLTSSGAY